MQNKIKLLCEESKGFIGSRSAQLWGRFDQGIWMFVLPYNQNTATLLGKRGKTRDNVKGLIYVLILKGGISYCQHAVLESSNS